jgi:GNAT superfamily N-acetyltransferase
VEESKLVIRAAEPTAEDGAYYGRSLDDIAPGFRYTVGRRAADVIAQAFTRPGHCLSHEHAFFGVLAGEVVGVTAGYTAPEHRASDPVLRQTLADIGVPRPRAAMLAKWVRYFGPNADDEYYLWLLYVVEEYRGQGIGAALMDFMEDRARDRGAVRLCLDADARNEATRRFYERRGMSVESEWPNLPLVPAQVVRLTKAL